MSSFASCSYHQMTDLRYVVSYTVNNLINGILLIGAIGSVIAFSEWADVTAQCERAVIDCFFGYLTSWYSGIVL